MPKGKGYKGGKMAGKGRRTRPGAVDDDAMKRVKSRNKKMKSTMRQIFDDNDTGRHSGPIDK